MIWLFIGFLQRQLKGRDHNRPQPALQNKIAPNFTGGLFHFGGRGTLAGYELGEVSGTQITIALDNLAIGLNFEALAAELIAQAELRSAADKELPGLIAGARAGPLNHGCAFCRADNSQTLIGKGRLDRKVRRDWIRNHKLLVLGTGYAGSRSHLNVIQCAVARNAETVVFHPVGMCILEAVDLAACQCRGRRRFAQT